MSLPPLVELTNFEASAYIEKIYAIFNNEVANAELVFLDLPIKCPWHPPSDNKHFCFWHLISENSNGGVEDDRILDMRRCERIRWISYLINNAYNKEDIWCWEKSVQTNRGKSNHIVLYLHKEQYLVVLRRKPNRLELVTAYVRKDSRKMIKVKEKYKDPRKCRGRTSATSDTPSTLGR